MKHSPVNRIGPTVFEKSDHLYGGVGVEEAVLRQDDGDDDDGDGDDVTAVVDELDAALEHGDDGGDDGDAAD